MEWNPVAAATGNMEDNCKAGSRITEEVLERTKTNSHEPHSLESGCCCRPMSPEGVKDTKKKKIYNVALYVTETMF